jgi:aspartate/methionine/tyrosine aminotransferase
VITPPLAHAASQIRPSVFAELQSRIDAHVRAGGRLIPLHIGDTVRPPPDAARLSVAAAGDDPALYRYGPTAGLSALREAVAARVASELGDGETVDAEQEVLIGAGATHALACLLRCILEPGDEVVLPTPFWPLTPGVIEAAGGRVVEVPLHPVESLPERIAAARTARTKVVYLISPNNPDGTVIPSTVVARVHRDLVERRAWLVADEVYFDYIYGERATRMAAHPGARDHTITVGSLSKSHALAGARVGWAVAPAPLITAARRMSVHTLFNVPLVAQRAALAALREGDGWIAAALEDYRSARAIALEGLAPLARHGVEWRVPDGGSYVFLELGPLLRRAGHEASSARPLLESMIDAGVLLSPGDASGSRHATAARLCFTAVELADLREGIARIAATVERAVR